MEALVTHQWKYSCKATVINEAQDEDIEILFKNQSVYLSILSNLHWFMLALQQSSQEIM